MGGVTLPTADLYLDGMVAEYTAYQVTIRRHITMFGSSVDICLNTAVNIKPST